MFENLELGFMNGEFNLTECQRSNYETFQGQLLLGFTRLSCVDDLYTNPTNAPLYGTLRGTLHATVPATH